MKRTKIIATLGPATSSPETIDELMRAGVDVVRINFSHGNSAEHVKLVDIVRDRANANGRQVGVMVDLQGPKIRIGKFINEKATLVVGQKFSIDDSFDLDGGTDEVVGSTYASLHEDLKRGDTLVLDDGRIVMWVVEVVGTRIICEVKIGGILSNNKGINVKGGGLSASALTPKDLEDIKVAAQMQADYLAVSFVRSKDDVEKARSLIAQAGWDKCGIVAKIERAEAVKDKNIGAIIESSEVVMVARGDLGVEIDDSNLPQMQKKIIKMARSSDTVVITATQMMESMINNPIPTRAEVFDVANAVLDGTDAVMLSAETAIGKYPEETVKSMARICSQAEKQNLVTHSGHRNELQFERVDETIAMAAMYAANHLSVKAIACLTESGATTLWMSRISSGIPIFAMARNINTRRKVTMYRGVYPVNCFTEDSDFVEDRENFHKVNERVINEMVRRGSVRDGDYVIITKGDVEGLSGGTNMLKIIKVGEHIVG